MNRDTLLRRKQRAERAGSSFRQRIDASDAPGVVEMKRLYKGPIEPIGSRDP